MEQLNEFVQKFGLKPTSTQTNGGSSSAPAADSTTYKSTRLILHICNEYYHFVLLLRYHAMYE